MISTGHTFGVRDRRSQARRRRRHRRVRGNTVVAVAIGEPARPIGALIVADAVKPSSAQAIAHLTDLGLSTVLPTVMTEDDRIERLPAPSASTTSSPGSCPKRGDDAITQLQQAGNRSPWPWRCGINDARHSHEPTSASR
ncbi:MAG: hypothetical protein R2710_01670 [Acidimicrobiales bacterium]